MIRRVLGDILIPFLFLTILLGFSLWLGYLAGQTYPKESLELFQKLMRDFALLKDVNLTAIFLFVFLNNAVKCFAVAALGFFFGLIPILFIFISGLLLGITSSVIIANQGLDHLLTGIIPHGLLEIPAFLIAGAYGMRLGKKYYHKMRYKEPLGPAFARTMKNTTKYVLPLVALASVIETYVATGLLHTL